MLGSPSQSPTILAAAQPLPLINEECKRRYAATRQNVPALTLLTRRHAVIELLLVDDAEARQRRHPDPFVVYWVCFLVLR